MTAIGHGLMGVSLGLVCMPSRWQWPGKVVLLAVFALLAWAPDVPTKVWGYGVYRVFHSIFVSAAILTVPTVVMLIWPRLREKIGGSVVVGFGWAAWLSHHLLDSFYNHNLGVAIFWPFSDARLNLTLPWFRTLGGLWRISERTVRVALVELLFYGTLVLVCAMGRWWVLRRRERARPGGAEGSEAWQDA